MKKLPKFVQDDMWLMPYSEAIIHRVQAAAEKEKKLVGESSLYEFAGGYLYFGLHKTENGWVIREWAPNATSISVSYTHLLWRLPILSGLKKGL